MIITRLFRKSFKTSHHILVLRFNYHYTFLINGIQNRYYYMQISRLCGEANLTIPCITKIFVVILDMVTK